MKQTFIELEFDTGATATGQAPLGDIASSLVSVDELLRDLATIAAHASGVEYREIRVAAISMRNPLKVRLSLIAIPTEAVTAFQEMCRDIIIARERSQGDSKSMVDDALALCAPDARISEQEAQRMRGHITTLQNAAVPLTRVVKEE